MAIEIADLPINTMVVFQFATLVYQRVITLWFHEKNDTIWLFNIAMDNPPIFNR